MVEHHEREPPRLDVVTRWNSTLEMFRQAIKDRDVLNFTISNLTISSDFNGYALTVEDWSHIHAMEELARYTDRGFYFSRRVKISHIIASISSV